MALLSGMIATIIVAVLILIISALPLYFAVKVMGGKTSILKAILITILSGFVTGTIELYFRFGGLIALIALIFLYKMAFDLSFGKAVIAWLLQIIIVTVMSVVAVALFGISLLALVL